MSKTPDSITDACPYCSHAMSVTSMTCHRCNVTIEAQFPSTRLGQLSTEHQRFIEMFVLASGSLKEIAIQTGVSYPTVRARLDRIIDDLRHRIESSAIEASQVEASKSEAAKANEMPSKPVLPRRIQQRS